MRDLAIIIACCLVMLTALNVALTTAVLSTLNRFRRTVMATTSNEAQSIADLTVTVASIKTVAGSAVAAIKGISDKLAAALAAQAAGDNSAALNALNADLASSAAELAAAIPANTDAVPPPVASSTPSA